ncbi:MAG: hypothetical protein ABJC74_17830 [Gemmatimonadota bacterium]
MADYPLADMTLARRLERAEALSNAAFVDARIRVSPELGARWIEVAGALAMFDGVGSPCTQTFGLGIFAPVAPAALAELEEFFQSRGADVDHEVSPLADPSALELLPARGYRPIEMSTVLFRPLAGPSGTQPDGISVRRTGPSDASLWARTAAEGWRDHPAVADLVYELGMVMTQVAGTELWLAEMNEVAVAAGALSLREGVGLLAGASTIPEWRGRGAQAALLRTRLESAVEQGADLAMICTQPGGASQRNAERKGFRIAYTRTKWRLVRSG